LLQRVKEVENLVTMSPKISVEEIQRKIGCRLNYKKKEVKKN